MFSDFVIFKVIFPTVDRHCLSNFAKILIYFWMFFNRQRSSTTYDLDRKLRAVSQAEEESNKRNKDLLKTLTKVSKQANTLNDKTERLRRIRVSYFIAINNNLCLHLSGVNDEPISKVLPYK